MAWPDDQFTRLFNDAYPGIVRFLKAFMGDPELARDTAQEAFTRLYRQGPGAVPPEAARYWVLRTSRNLALNELNRRRRWSRLSALLGAHPEEGAPGAEAARLGLEKSLIQAALVKELNPDQRAALLLKEMEGMRYREIAATLGVSESKVKVDIHRARMSLRRAWARESRAGARRRTEGEHGL